MVVTEAMVGRKNRAEKSRCRGCCLSNARMILDSEEEEVCVVLDCSSV